MNHAAPGAAYAVAFSLPSSVLPPHVLGADLQSWRLGPLCTRVHRGTPTWLCLRGGLPPLLPADSFPATHASLTPCSLSRIICCVLLFFSTCFRFFSSLCALALRVRVCPCSCALVSPSLSHACPSVCCARTDASTRCFQTLVGFICRRKRTRCCRFCGFARNSPDGGRRVETESEPFATTHAAWGLRSLCRCKVTSWARSCTSPEGECCAVLLQRMQRAAELGSLCLSTSPYTRMHTASSSLPPCLLPL